MSRPSSTFGRACYLWQGSHCMSDLLKLTQCAIYSLCYHYVYYKLLVSLAFPGLLLFDCHSHQIFSRFPSICTGLVVEIFHPLEVLGIFPWHAMIRPCNFCQHLKAKHSSATLRGGCMCVLLVSVLGAWVHFGPGVPMGTFTETGLFHASALSQVLSCLCRSSLRLTLLARICWNSNSLRVRANMCEGR